MATWQPLMVDWDMLTDSGKLAAIDALISGDNLDKLALKEVANTQICLRIVANKHTRSETLDFLMAHADEEVRLAITQHRSVH